MLGSARAVVVTAGELSANEARIDVRCFRVAKAGLGSVNIASSGSSSMSLIDAH